ncbi:hypothetical protein AVEN_85388-1, partial [Araneus ventricosus]
QLTAASRKWRPLIGDHPRGANNYGPKCNEYTLLWFLIYQCREREVSVAGPESHGFETRFLKRSDVYTGLVYHQKYFLRTYHRAFYGSLPEHDPVTSTRDARLNGYLSGHGNVEDMEKDEYLSELSDEQLRYVRKYMTGEQKAPTVEPFVRTVIQVGWNFMKKAIGF